jgi:polyhydroxyalkanoate synthesis regulator phasin
MVQTRQLRALGFAAALVAAALIGGTLISGVFAAPSQDGSDGTTAAHLGGGEYCEVYLDTLAAELGVDRAALGAASKAAATAVVDAALADGEIDEERATELRERIAELDETDCATFGLRAIGGRHGGPGPGFRIGFMADALGAAADALGVAESDVIEAFADGTSLQEQAEAQGVDYATVSAAVTEAVRATLADEVADGDINQERADEVVAEVEEWLAEGGEPRLVRPGRGGPWGFGA